MYFMKRQWLTILILFASVFIVSYLVGSCKKHDIVHITTSLEQVIPDGFPQPVYRFEDNPLTEKDFNWEENYFMMAASPVTQVSPVHPVTRRSLFSVLMNTTEVMVIISHTHSETLRHFSILPGRKNFIGTGNSSLYMQKPLNPS
jgi:hypothetical protein